MLLFYFLLTIRSLYKKKVNHFVEQTMVGFYLCSRQHRLLLRKTIQNKITLLILHSLCVVFWFNKNDNNMLV